MLKYKLVPLHLSFISPNEAKAIKASEELIERLFRKTFILRKVAMSHFCSGFVYNVSVIGNRESQKHGGNTMQLTGELKEKVEKTESKEEAKKTIEEAGMILDDAELDQVSGGAAMYTFDDGKK